MAKSSEFPDGVRCCVCQKSIRISARRKTKMINGSGVTKKSQARQLQDDRWVCSDTCFDLAVNPPKEEITLNP